VGKTRQVAMDRRFSKNRARVPIFFIASRHNSSARSQTVWKAKARRFRETNRERREVGGASGQSYLGARLGLSFKGLTVAGTPNFSTLPDGALQRVAYP
jgi:hypothetical protein